MEDSVDIIRWYVHKEGSKEAPEVFKTEEEANARCAELRKIATEKGDIKSRFKIIQGSSVPISK